MQDLASRTILITGADGLLGRNFATRFAEHGSTVVLVDINDAIEDFSSQLLAKDYKVYCVKSDISKKESWYNINEFLKDKNLFCDVLINNACTKSENFFEAFEDFSVDDWQQVMAVNVTAPMLACQVIGKEMAKNNRGSIINISSIYGLVAPDQSIYEGSEYLGRSINTPAVYSVSKAAILGLTKYLATYWGKNKIRVNAIIPGGVYSGQNETFTNKYIAKVPLMRMAQPEDIVGAALYLASDMSSYVTGQNLVVDGGWSTW